MDRVARASGVNAARRRLILGGTSLVVTGMAGCGSRPTPRVAWLVLARDPKKRLEIAQGVRDEFARRGLVDRSDVSLEFEMLGDGEEAEDQIRRIVASRPAAIAGGGVSIYLPLLMRLTHEIPIVFHDWNDPSAACGIVRSLRRPGANVTGTTHALWLPRVLWLVQEFDPSIRIIGVLTNKDLADSLFARDYWRENQQCQRREAEALARRYGVELRPIEMHESATSAELEDAVARSGAQALSANAVFPWTDAFLEFERRCRIPTIGAFLSNVRKGVLVGISFESTEGVEQSIGMVARIVRGEKPGDIPIYRHMRYVVGLNLRTAAAAGIRIPDSILVQAVEIVR